MRIKVMLDSSFSGLGAVSTYYFWILWSSHRMTVLLTLLAMTILLADNSYASNIRSTISWRANDGKTGVAHCHDNGRVCVESGERIIDGIKVIKPCWKYSYSKICDFPSKNDCALISHCYEIGLKECLMHDSIGNCVNQKKEFSCKRREIFIDEKERVKQRIKGDEAKKIVCKGIPCIDGNCVDKSYDMDEDMMKSASQLYASSQVKGANDMNSELFKGFDQHCTKRPTGVMNCCKVKGLLEPLGASCNPDEIKLRELQQKNLCVYVGKSTSGTRPVHVNKHHFCCFGNVLNKVFQVEARKQLGMNFGHGGFPNCRGITLDEITKLDFEKMDFSEFVLEIKKRIKVPNVADIQMRVQGSISSTQNKSGVSDKLKMEMADDSEY